MQSTRCHLLPSRADRFTFAAARENLSGCKLRESTSFFLVPSSRLLSFSSFAFPSRLVFRPSRSASSKAAKLKALKKAKRTTKWERIGRQARHDSCQGIESFKQGSRSASDTRRYVARSWNVLMIVAPLIGHGKSMRSIRNRGIADGVKSSAGANGSGASTRRITTRSATTACNPLDFPIHAVVPRPPFLVYRGLSRCLWRRKGESRSSENVPRRALLILI